MSMVNFDENQIIANGAKIYDQRAKIEAIADSIVDNGFDLLLFTSSGGSQAMLDPFAFYIRHMSRLPVENVLSANLLTGDCNRITDKTVAFLTSKSGDTAETVKAANWLKEQGVRLFTGEFWHQPGDEDYLASLTASAVFLRAQLDRSWCSTF